MRRDKRKKRERGRKWRRSEKIAAYIAWCSARDAGCRWRKMRAIVTTARHIPSHFLLSAIYRFCPRFLSSIHISSYIYENLRSSSFFHYRTFSHIILYDCLSLQVRASIQWAEATFSIKFKSLDQDIHFEIYIFYINICYIIIIYIYVNYFYVK